MTELTPQQQQQVEELFAQLLDAAADQRVALLEQRCADPQVRGEVQSLFAARPVAEQILEAPAVDATAFAEAVRLAAESPQAADPAAEDHPDSIGPFRILHKIGEGGMGTIYAAEQHGPLRRRVALKIIKLGMDTRQVISRFEAERQALALMNHPNVARALDAGATADGRPYFVMEYVEGQHITDFCDGQRLDVRQRLELFMCVCRAIQHAHQKGVIHRDIKPSNVLASRDNGSIIPKVIDFGVAKATNQRLTEQTFYTEQGIIIGTPEYMSPEQAGSSTDINTRTDVYSLGVLLYELLVGARPLETDSAGAGQLDQLQRLIREQEPLKPSTRLSGLGAEAAEAANKRRTDSSTLRRKLRGDLDWVVMKCLEKDRERRYASAAELIDDLERFLQHQPVVAGPPSVGYRARKFARRHRALVSATAAVFCVLLAGIVSTAVFAARASEERSEAQQQAETARTVSQFLNNMLSSVDPKQGQGRDVGVLRDILDQAAARVDSELTGHPRVQASVRRTIGQTYMNLAFYAESEPHLEQALEIERSVDERPNADLATSLHLLGILRDYQGRYPEAEALLGEAIEMRRDLPDLQDRYLASSLDRLAVLLLRQGRLDEAKPLLDEARLVLEGDDREAALADAVRNTLAAYHNKRGEYAEAEALFREGLAAYQDRPDHPDRLVKLNNLAIALKEQGQIAEAEVCLVDARERGQRIFGPEHPFTLSASNALAGVMELQERYAESEALHREVLTARRRVLGEKHPGVHSSLHNLCNCLLAQQKQDQALGVCRESVAFGRQVLGPQHPGLALSLATLGFALRDTTDPARFSEAEALILEALSLLESSLPPDHPFVMKTLRGLRKLYAADAMNDPDKYARIDEQLETLAADDSRP